MFALVNANFGPSGPLLYYVDVSEHKIPINTQIKSDNGFH